MKEILKTGYQGHVAQEFIPLGEDPIASLQTAFTICDV
jgi:hydroxypyruvate isomerase